MRVEVLSGIVNSLSSGVVPRRRVGVRFLKGFVGAGGGVAGEGGGGEFVSKYMCMAKLSLSEVRAPA